MNLGCLGPETPFIGIFSGLREVKNHLSLEADIGMARIEFDKTVISIMVLDGLRFEWIIVLISQKRE